ncbi:hypothetical protein [Streptomyces regalis]|uniref:hypothetical protein n=1 Tax=Streptomyces regalis TaxID=68262 RepID=UPI000B11C67F|nr:hypothetical protein [Streptomyces regalis]
MNARTRHILAALTGVAALAAGLVTAVPGPAAAAAGSMGGSGTAVVLLTEGRP